MKIEYPVGRVEDSDLWFALSVLLWSFEKDGFALFALGLGLFCMVSKIFGAFLLGIQKSIKRKTLQNRREKMNENEFELNGKKYVTRTISPEDEDECDGNVCIMCAFEHDDVACQTAPPCADFERYDHREVVFIEA